MRVASSAVQMDDVTMVENNFVYPMALYCVTQRYGQLLLTQAEQSPRSPVPAFLTIWRFPRQRGHVLLGKAPLPLDEESRGGDAVAVGKSAFTLVTLVAFDIEAARIVFEAWLLSVSADGGVVELVSDSFILGHG